MSFCSSKFSLVLLTLAGRHTDPQTRHVCGENLHFEVHRHVPYAPAPRYIHRLTITNPHVSPLVLTTRLIIKGEGKAILVQNWTGPEGTRQSAHVGGKFVSPTHWPLLPPRKYSWYSFPLDTESTSGP